MDFGIVDPPSSAGRAVASYMDSSAVTGRGFNPHGGWLFRNFSRSNFWDFTAGSRLNLENHVIKPRRYVNVTAKSKSKFPKVSGTPASWPQEMFWLMHWYTSITKLLCNDGKYIIINTFHYLGPRYSETTQHLTTTYPYRYDEKTIASGNKEQYENWQILSIFFDILRRLLNKK